MLPQERDRPGGPYEISDLVVGAEVDADEVIATLRAAGQHRAARIVARMPRRGRLLDADVVAATMRRVHTELQRLGEELQIPRRIAADLLALRARGCTFDRVVDLGCGTGHVLRQLARTGVSTSLDGRTDTSTMHDRRGTELVGVDLDPGLIALADALRVADRLPCRFVLGDALDPALGMLDERTVVISSGFLHHLRGPTLSRMLASLERAGVAGFLHYDPRPGPIATLGAVVFHQARMREPISRHDGPMSVRRAYPASVLRAAAARSCPSYEVCCVDSRNPLEVLRPLVGLRRVHTGGAVAEASGAPQ